MSGFIKGGLTASLLTVKEAVKEERVGSGGGWLCRKANVS